MERCYYVYILANKSRSSVYIGITNDLLRRIYEHKYLAGSHFTHQYNVNRLVYFEQTSDVTSALAREKQLKNWHRSWKNRLIETANADWRDLSAEWLDPEP